jgi:hypothetical protein
MNEISNLPHRPTTTPLRTIRERDALESRVRSLEAALSCIARETEVALGEPRIAFLVTRRIASIATLART